MKLIFRYIVALAMIPMGVVCGVLGVIQNRLRKDHYDSTYKIIMAEVKTEENPPPANDQEKSGGE